MVHHAPALSERILRIDEPVHAANDPAGIVDPERVGPATAVEHAEPNHLVRRGPVGRLHESDGRDPVP